MNYLPFFFSSRKGATFPFCLHTLFSRFHPNLQTKMLSENLTTAKNGRKFPLFSSPISLSAFFCILMAIELGSSSDFKSELNRLSRPIDSCSKMAKNETGSRNLAEESLGSVIITPNSTILSRNRTFEFGFFCIDSNWYVGIWYAIIPIRTYVWIANRGNPVKNISSATVKLTGKGHLAVTDSAGIPIWLTENNNRAITVELLETGNLVLFSHKGKEVWKSFDFPTDTWLPGMNITTHQMITCWKSASDPAPGNYSLRLKPPQYGEFELVFNKSDPYWSTGNWTGNSFVNVPEMTVPYIYNFIFRNPFTPEAYFVYTETLSPAVTGDGPLLTRFSVDSSGQFKQYTWSPQTENWNMFWSVPSDSCHVYGLCGNLGFCNGISRSLSPCDCLAGFLPADQSGWISGDFSSGCRRERLNQCDNGSDVDGDGFLEVGNSVTFNGAVSVLFSGGLRFCEESCLKNCSCFGLRYNSNSSQCENLYGNLLNLRNLTSDSTIGSSILYVRVSKGVGSDKKKKWEMGVFMSGFSLAVFGMLVLVLVVLRKKKKRRKKDEESIFPFTNLKIFTYKELQAATRGFSDKLGHGGFGTVFRGELTDSTELGNSAAIAVKRLERPGGGEREFRAEVCTIGNIQHVNLVRLRGFCSENSHRLLVYDYMPNGPLSVFLRRDGPSLSWDVRFGVAVGTARGIAYLHEECRDCIIHCDIKPENILLDGEFSAQVSDFGLAKLVGRDFSRVMTTMRGTWGYVAPEWISGVAITAKADVYSYGMTLLEIIGGRRNVEAPPPHTGTKQNLEASHNVETPLNAMEAPPFNVEAPLQIEVPPDSESELETNQTPGFVPSPCGVRPTIEEKWFFPPWAVHKILEGDIASIVDPRLASAYDAEEASRAALVAVWCIQDEEGARPTMGTVVKMLEGIVDVGMPPAPQLLQALVAGDSFPSGGIISDPASSTSTGVGIRYVGSPVSRSLNQVR
ncbi:receptor-like protein kinase 4 [Tasmannia lanceolata]|uniref:receptor-like protein kinase 4 n=1 Tax=Tasmannia lanceolata TaxID=3420 RepID=UPI004063CEEC